MDTSRQSAMIVLGFLVTTSPGRDQLVATRASRDQLAITRPSRDQHIRDQLVATILVATMVATFNSAMNKDSCNQQIVVTSNIKTRPLIATILVSAMIATFDFAIEATVYNWCFPT